MIGGVIGDYGCMRLERFCHRWVSFLVRCFFLIFFFFVLYVEFIILVYFSVLSSRKSWKNIGVKCRR